MLGEGVTLEEILWGLVVVCLMVVVWLIWRGDGPPRIDRRD
jgi:hypothetical protein